MFFCYLGRLVEEGFIDEIFLNFCYFYIKFFLLFVLVIYEYEKCEKIEVKGEIIFFFNLFLGCVFYKRCLFVFDCCMKEIFDDIVIDSKYKVKCYFYS